jgi:hypothetical protein
MKLFEQNLSIEYTGMNSTRIVRHTKEGIYS